MLRTHRSLHASLIAPQANDARIHGRLAKVARRSTLCRAEIVSGEAYEDIIDALARRAIDRTGLPASTSTSTASSPSSPSAGSSSYRGLLVGVAGVPGSGKSTLAAAVAARINELWSEQGQGQGQGQPPYAAVLPMDGFHFYRWELDSMPDPKEAHARRGAPWTFDAVKFVAAVRRVRYARAAGPGGSGGGTAVRVPSFDHGVGDPVEDDIIIPAEAAVVLVEGNYVLLQDDPWGQLRELFDEAWFVDCPIDVAMGRVFARQVAIGLAPEVSRRRIASNDRPNAELVAASASAATLMVPSTVPFRRKEA